MGDISVARAHLEAAVGVAKAIGEPHPRPSENLRWVLRAERDLDGARSRFEEALTTSRSLQFWHLAWCLFTTSVDAHRRAHATAIIAGIGPAG